MAARLTYSDPILELLSDYPAPAPAAPSMVSTPDAPVVLSRPDGVAAKEGLPEPIPAITDEAGIARLLGLSASRIRTLARDGVLVRSGRGRFDVRRSLGRYIGQLRDHAAQAGRPSEGGDALKAQRLRLTRAQAEAVELKNLLAAGEMVAADAVLREWAGILRDVRAALLAVPTRCGATLPHLTPHDVAAIDSEIKSALERLSDGN